MMSSSTIYAMPVDVANLVGTGGFTVVTASRNRIDGGRKIRTNVVYTFVGMIYVHIYR